MSNLRKIMQKLAQHQPEIHKTSQQKPDQPGERTRGHVEAYQRQLDECSPAMLQYELVWLDERIASLQLCLSQEEMLTTAGGPAQVELWLEETRQCRQVLERRMTLRGVSPALHPQAVASCEHAWELREESIKKLWGWS